MASQIRWLHLDWLPYSPANKHSSGTLAAMESLFYWIGIWFSFARGRFVALVKNILKNKLELDLFFFLRPKQKQGHYQKGDSAGWRAVNMYSENQARRESITELLLSYLSTLLCWFCWFSPLLNQFFLGGREISCTFCFVSMCVYHQEFRRQN